VLSRVPYLRPPPSSGDMYVAVPTPEGFISLQGTGFPCVETTVLHPSRLGIPAKSGSYS
jgi:hypothetical protein